MSHDVEVKPYGTKNLAGSIPVPEKVTTTVEVKPPYGQRNVDEVRPLGARSDIEVKPYGTSEHQIPRESLLKPRAASRPLDLSQFRNPLMATALGITLALLLWSLSHLPRMISGWWHPDHSLQYKQSAYDTVRSYGQDAAREMRRDTRDMRDQASYRAGEVYQTGKDTLDSAKDKASQMYNNAKESVEATGQQIYDKAKQAAGGSGDSYYSSSSLTDEARRAACRTAERARDIACQTGDYAPREETFLHRVGDVQNKASEIYEAAKSRAAEMLEAAKNTVTYPVIGTADTISRTTERVVQTGENAAGATYQAAKDKVVQTGDSVRDAASSTFQAAKDTVRGAAETVMGSKDTVKDTVLGAGEAVKDTLVGAGETLKHAAASTAQGVKDTVVGAGQAVRETVVGHGSESDKEYITREARGPTKIKVEVQEL
jgi:gas vesicle protein